MQIELLEKSLKKHLEKDQFFSIEEDFEKFTRSILTHSGYLKEGAKKLTKDFYDAEELHQETYLQALRAHKNYREKNTMRQWLYRIMYNLFVNKYNKKKRAPKTIDQDFSVLEGKLKTINNKGLEDLLLKEDLLEGIKDLIFDETYIILKAIPRQNRNILIYCYIYGKSYKDAASNFGICLGTVRSRASRGRSIFKKKFLLMENRNKN